MDSHRRTSPSRIEWGLLASSRGIRAESAKTRLDIVRLRLHVANELVRLRGRYNRIIESRIWIAGEAGAPVARHMGRRGPRRARCVCVSSAKRSKNAQMPLQHDRFTIATRPSHDTVAFETVTALDAWASLSARQLLANSRTSRVLARPERSARARFGSGDDSQCDSPRYALGRRRRVPDAQDANPEGVALRSAQTPPR